MDERRARNLNVYRKCMDTFFSNDLFPVKRKKYTSIHLRFNRERIPKRVTARKSLKSKSNSVVIEMRISKVMHKIEIFCTVCFESEFGSINSINYFALLSISRKADTKPSTRPMTIIHG